VSLDLRVYSALLRLYPRAFRERFGAEMEQAATDLVRDAGGRFGACRVWCRLLLDLIPSVLRERRSVRQEQARELVSPREEASMATLIQDLRYALRTLRRAPAFALVVIVSLAIGIGANTLVYTVVDGLILRPFAYPDPDRLVAIGVSFPRLGTGRSAIEALSPAEFLDVRDGSQTLERYTVFDLGNRSISGGDRAERVFSAFLWGDPFSTVGIRPALGRGFVEEETYREGAAEAVISWRIWQSRFGGDSGIVGRTIRVNGVPTTVVGIMPPSLLLLGTDLWLPLGFDPKEMPRDRRQYSILARLRPGVSAAAANAELKTIAARVEAANVAEREEYTGWSLAVIPWATVTVGDFRPAGLALAGAVALVLLIACANIASLMLVRAAGRERELTIRHALGAGAGRIARQLFTESLVLTLVGAIVGTLIAALLLRPVVGLFPDIVTQLALRPALNLRILGITVLVAMLTGLLVGFGPAWRFGRWPATVPGGETARFSTGVASNRLRQGFTVAQIALALMLLAGAGVLLRSFLRLRDVDPGINVTQVLTMRLSLPREKYSMQGIAPFFENLAQRIRQIPGVENAGATTQFPPGNAFTSRLWQESAPNEPGAVVDVSNVTEQYFGTMGYQLIAGRGVSAIDIDSAPRVAVLNQTAALKLFPGATPIGQRIRLGQDQSGPDWREVVGVVADARNRGLAKAVEPEVFVPVRQQDVAANNQLFLVIRTRGEPLALLPEIRATIAAVDPDQPIYAVHTLSEAFADSVATRRAAMILLAVFAGIALSLAALGVYGLLSYLVSQRTHEIGIRMALGADRGTVRQLILRQTLMVVGTGTAIGLAGAFAVGRLLQELVFQVKPADPLTLALVAALLAGIGLMAAYGPTRRATRVSPMEALRGEL